jgi:hypothetical protein
MKHLVRVHCYYQRRVIVIHSLYTANNTLDLMRSQSDLSLGSYLSSNLLIAPLSHSQCFRVLNLCLSLFYTVHPIQGDS